MGNACEHFLDHWQALNLKPWSYLCWWFDWWGEILTCIEVVYPFDIVVHKSTQCLTVLPIRFEIPDLHSSRSHSSVHVLWKCYILHLSIIATNFWLNCPCPLNWCKYTWAILDVEIGISYALNKYWMRRFRIILLHFVAKFTTESHQTVTRWQIVTRINVTIT